MKEKKTAVITIRTTEYINEWLTEKAEEKQWTKAQLVENIIKEFVYGTDEAENEEAKEIFQYIQESKCDLDKLAKWTINNNKFETFRLGLEVWKTLIAERERKIRYHRSNQDAT